MKAPDYVYSIVDVYRHQIDDMLAGTTVAKDEKDARQRQLKRCFNRDFTHAYQDGTSGDEMMSYERSNNRGQIVGTVLGSRPANRDVRGLKPTAVAAPPSPVLSCLSPWARATCWSFATITSLTSS